MKYPAKYSKPQLETLATTVRTSWGACAPGGSDTGDGCDGSGAAAAGRCLGVGSSASGHCDFGGESASL